MANELYRQLVHIVLGIIAALTALVLPQKAFMFFWGAITLVYIIAVFAAHKHLGFLFRVLERPDAAFRGKGGLFFFLGIFAVGGLFYENAVLAILLLAIPDGLATVLAPLVNSPRLPYNKRKSVFGSAVFFVSASLLLSLWFQELAIFLIAFLLTALESFDYRDIPFLDDNIVIPLVAGFLLQLL